MPRMANYLLISSLDPFESKATNELFVLASSLVKGNDQVAIFFVQNGVFSVIPEAVGSWIADAAAIGVNLFADAFSLKERGITDKRIDARVRRATLDIVLDAMARGDKVLWH